MPRPFSSRTPSDLLGERRTYMSRFGAGRAPALREFQVHAERYGGEEVVETAAECGYGFASLVRLTDFCDRVDAALQRKLHPRARAQSRQSSELRVRALLGEEEPIA